MMNEILISGGISGGITDPESPEAIKHAELYYEEIRKMTTDVKLIAQNTNFTESQIMLVKDYLFIAKHDIWGGFRRFDESFAIAESWRRLAFDRKNIQPHDIILIKHELKELGLVAQGVSQELAHEISSKEYNYSKKQKDYYLKLGLKKNNNVNKIISGAISTREKELNDYENDYSRW